MESTPPIVPAEYEPSLEPSKPKARRNIFELFKRREDEPELEQTDSTEAKTKKSPEKSAAKAEKLPPASERRRFAADIIMLARANTERPDITATPDAEPVTAISSPELAPIERATLKPVEAPKVLELAPLPLIERAKEMGRGVLKLIGRVKSDVAAADRGERMTRQTDLQPLEIADADVRAAMQELIAPIEEYEAAHPQPAITPELPTPEQTPESDAITAAVEMGGGDAEPGLLERPKSPLARTFEVAAAVASVTAREMLETKERYAGRVRKIGLFALGAATAGGFAYTWRRMRKLKKEQLAQRKEHKRFEAEVRAAQVREEQRLQELEQTNVSRLTQPQRQQFVQEVSEFAHAQASEIRTTARATEIIQQSPEAPVRTQRAGKSATDAAQETVFTHRKFERPEQPHGSVFDAPAVPERGGIIERLGNVVSGAKRSAPEDGMSTGGGAAAAGAKLVGAPTNRAPGAGTSPQDAPQNSPKKYTQAWLLGAALATGLVVVVLLLTGVL